MDQPFDIEGFDSETKYAIGGRGTGEQATQILGKISCRIESISIRVFVGQAGVKILQRPARKMCRLQRSREQVRAGARHGAERVALGRVKDVLEQTEHFRDPSGRLLFSASLRWPHAPPAG
jgi:hypothetical protein